MWLQKEFYLDERTRGFHPVTDEVLGKLPALPRTGLLHLFIKHTSEVDELLGALEGDDDMPAHAKSLIIGQSVIVPITRGCLNLGTWQGIYLCEFRNRGGRRQVVATITGE